MERLHQQNGKNWRECLVEDDRLILTSNIDGNERRAVLPFDAGLISPDVDDADISERMAAGKIAGLLVGVSLLGLLGSFPLLGSKNPALMGVGMALGVASLVGFFFALNKSQPKKVNALRVYMGNSSFYCYGRNAQDRDQVAAFIAKVADAQKVYFRKKYLARNEATTEEQIRGRLSWLYEHQFIDDDELAAELKKLPKK